MPNQPQNVGSCEGCRYAQPVVTASENIILECYRYPPTVMLTSDDTIVQVHPDAVYRCGEYTKGMDELLNDLKDQLHAHRMDREMRKQTDGSEE